MKKKLLLTAATLLISGTQITACTPVIAQRGNMIEDVQMEQVVTGIHTRTDVLRLLGSPTTTAPFDDTIWYYIGQETEKKGILDPAIIKERIVRVSFNDSGIVQAVEDVDAQRLNIPVERSKTPTNGNETTVAKEFFGNLGRFNPQQ